MLMVGTTIGQSENPWFVAVQSKGGFLISHRAVMSHLIRSRNKSFGVDLYQQVTDSPWSRTYGHPVRGISFSYQDFGNPLVLGQGYALSQYSIFSLFQTKRFGFLDVRLGSGFAYVTRKYDKYENPKNNAIGSHFNGYVQLQLAWTKYFNQWHIGTGIEFAHYSSCALVKPNLGLNTPQLFVTFGYQPQLRRLPESELKSTEGMKEDKQPHYFNLTLVGSTKQNLPGQTVSRNLPVIAFQGIYSHNLNRKWNLEGGLDIIYNEANRVKYDDLSFTPGQTLQVGVYVGAAANIFKTQIYFGLGGFVLNIINPAGYVYNRIGYRYHFNSNWNATLGVMANMGIADYLELGVGYRINRKEKAGTFPN